MKKFYNNLLKKYQLTAKDILITYFIFFLYYTSFLPIRQELFILIFVVSAFWFFRRRNFLSWSIVRYLILVVTLWVLQSFIFSNWGIVNFIRGLMAIFIPYFGIKLLGEKFIRAFIVIMVLITMISFVFYFPSYISKDYHQAIGKIAPTLGTDHILGPTSKQGQNFIIYTWENKSQNGLLRNSGNFTEPGYFACYLALALSLSIMYNRKFLIKENIIFIIALITTFSTAAYIALLFLMIFYLIRQKNKMLKILLVPVVVILSFYSYTKLDFLGEKIKYQFETQSKMSKTVGRFGATFRNLKEIKENPIFGRGIVSDTRFDNVVNPQYSYDVWQNLNSHTDLMVRYGVFGFIIFTIWLLKGFKNFFILNNFEKKYWILLVGSFYIVLATQPIISTPVFMSFLFWDRIREKLSYNYENISNNTKL